jgi:hypothetical protein
MMSSLLIFLIFYFPALMDLIIVHMVLVQKRERGFVSQCFGYDPCLLCHGVCFPCRHDFQLDGLYPCFEMSCFDGPHFSCCETCLVSFPVMGFLMLRGFSRADFSISYSYLKCLIACSLFFELGNCIGDQVT